MSLAGTASLGELRIQAQQRSDLENNPNVSTPEWNNYISKSYAKLYNKLVTAYGNDYFVQVPYQFAINSTQLYALPPDFFKLLGVDLQYSASPTGWVTLKKFEFIERNKYSWLNPIPISANIAQLWYIPKPTRLQFAPSCATTLTNATITTPDASDLVAGMNVYGNGIQTNTVINSINLITNPNQIVLSLPAQVTQVQAPIFFWNDSTTIDGIAGWEEFIIIDAAIKALIKQEQPIAELVAERQQMVADIEAEAEGRDAGQAHHVSDALSVNTPIISLGASNLRYRLIGSQIQFVPSGYDETNGLGSGSYGSEW